MGSLEIEMDTGAIAFAIMAGLAISAGLPPVLSGRWGAGVAFVLLAGAALISGFFLTPVAGLGLWLVVFVAACLYAGSVKRQKRRHAELIAASRAR